jgi:hypothetical protein
MLWQWEKVDNSTRRMRVPGGWIVETYYESIGPALAICFVPDIEKKLELTENKPKEGA